MKTLNQGPNKDNPTTIPTQSQSNTGKLKQQAPSPSKGSRKSLEMEGQMIAKGMVLRIDPESETPFPELNELGICVFRTFLQKVEVMRPIEAIDYLSKILGVISFHPALGQEIHDINVIVDTLYMLEENLLSDPGEGPAPDTDRQCRINLWYLIQEILQRETSHTIYCFSDELIGLAELIKFNYEKESKLMIEFEQACTRLSNSKVGNWDGSCESNPKPYIDFCLQHWEGCPMWKKGE